jgi:membrane-bound serine protease (ClpP class)
MDVLISDPFFSAGFVSLGLILLLLEVFIPSGGVLGLLSLGSVALGIYGFFHQDRPGWGIGALVTALVFVALALRFGLRRVRFSTSMGPDTSTSVDEEIPSMENKEGVALSPLRPAGVALIDGRRVDVVATGQFIAKDRPVRVVNTSGNRVVVREINLSQE